MEQRRYACDGCRRRRVRCDAVQPCAQCVRNGIRCTYGSTTSRQSATAYARNLEQQVVELQRQMQMLTDPSGSHSSSPSASQLQLQQVQVDQLVIPGNNLVLDQANGKKVYSSSAALNVLRTIVDMLDSGNGTTQSGQALVQALEEPADLPDSKSMDWLDALLPDKEQVWQKVNSAIDLALICHDCIDKDSIRERLDTTPPDTSPARRPFLALIYGLLALDSLYGESEYGGSETYSNVPAG